MLCPTMVDTCEKLNIRVGDHIAFNYPGEVVVRSGVVELIRLEGRMVVMRDAARDNKYRAFKIHRMTNLYFVRR